MLKKYMRKFFWCLKIIIIKKKKHLYLFLVLFIYLQLFIIKLKILSVKFWINFYLYVTFWNATHSNKWIEWKIISY